MNISLDKMLLSLDGLSVGDAFGELFFSMPAIPVSLEDLPQGPWRWTDDSHMALSVCETLELYGRINQDYLAKAFARRFMEEPYRGYGGGAAALMQRIARGDDWRYLSPKLFGGGSYGNGGAMRISPLGGFYGGDPEKAAAEARLSAEITHAHPEGQAGAMAVAAAAALAAMPNPPEGRDFLTMVLEFIPRGITRERTVLALDIPPAGFSDAVETLGTGDNVSAQDTVPFCLWIAAYNLKNYEKALWQTVQGLGDRDTTCAIVGGIVALSAGVVPAEWLKRREALPS
ncbi:MAG: ADP-ribosylglycohydrolase family protein [Deltaproteobacteria bacterium]|nr:ADP-ribosylglycohydrolase family protein [Deltaproteobacteria bacterium]